MEEYDKQKLKDFLGIEEHKVVPMVIAIGYNDPSDELNDGQHNQYGCPLGMLPYEYL